MKLSIITINKNNAEGLRKTIESVVSQTWKEFEYVVIDGNSTDESIEIIQQFNNSTNQQIAWISEQDKGVFNAMNKGVRMAKGDYLLFLNSGDFLIDNKVLENVFSENHSADILCGRCNVTENGKVVWTSNPPEYFTFSNFYNSTIAHQATFIKRDLFTKYGMYREDFKLMSDWEFWIRTIVLGDATTEKILVVISDYNLEGISSNQKNKEISEEEKQKVYNSTPLKYFVPDYDKNQLQHEKMKIMYWAWTKSIFRIPIEFFYNYITKFQ